MGVEPQEVHADVRCGEVRQSTLGQTALAAPEASASDHAATLRWAGTSKTRVAPRHTSIRS
ncbi:MAG TPA: hypothetical protein PLH31_15210, partial [Caulobacter sp.]|nr:hypothetical protein [Caulobacter sp.]